MGVWKCSARLYLTITIPVSKTPQCPAPARPCTRRRAPRTCRWTCPCRCSRRHPETWNISQLTSVSDIEFYYSEKVHPHCGKNLAWRMCGLFGNLVVGKQCECLLRVVDDQLFGSRVTIMSRVTPPVMRWRAVRSARADTRKKSLVKISNCSLFRVNQQNILFKCWTIYITRGCQPNQHGSVFIVFLSSLFKMASFHWLFELFWLKWKWNARNRW